MNAQIELALKNLRGRSFPGSNIINSYLYHNIPIEGYRSLSCHRKNTQQRFDIFKSEIDFENKTVLDLGCAVGGLSLLAAKEKALRVIGYDYDRNSINLANLIAQDLGLNNLEFKEKKINLDFINSIGSTNITFWLSQFMWIVKEFGMEIAKKCLFEISTKSDVLVFETATDRDGMAPIRGMSQNDVLSLLNKNTCYDNIRNLGYIKGWGKERNNYICENPMNQWKGYTSTLRRVSNTVVKKSFRGIYHRLLPREVECLKRLQKYPNFPKYISHDKYSVSMTFSGRRVDSYKEYADQKNDILNPLKEQGIQHRDIDPKNLLIMDNKLMLIDFAWAIVDEQDTAIPAPAVLGGKWNRGDDDKRVSDEIALDRCIQGF